MLILVKSDDIRRGRKAKVHHRRLRRHRHQLVDINSAQWQTKCNVEMLQQIEEIKELRIPSIVLATEDNLLLLIGEANYKLVFGRQRRTFCIQYSRTCHRMKILC